MIRPEPAEFLILARSIEAIKIHFVGLTALYLSARRLPSVARPSKATAVAVSRSIQFFVFFATYHLHDIVA